MTVNNNSIGICPKSLGIGSSMVVNYLGVRCYLFLNHIDNYTFRIIINNTDTGDCTRIEPILDKNTFTKYF